MVAVNYNFDIEKGSNFTISFVYNDSSGNPIDLSNKCVEFGLLGDDGSIRRYSSQALSDYNTNGWSITADNLGLINIRFSADQTQGFNFTTAVYDLDVKDVGTVKLNNVRLSQGSINLISRNLNINPNCALGLDALITIITPTPTSGSVVTPTPTVTTEVTDFCLPYDCGPLDLFSTVYNGSGLVLNDLSTITGSVTVTNTGLISNVELAINKLSHSSPTDLVLLLAPPSGDKILLSANHKTFVNNNFSFMFSNKADSNKYLHNISNGQTCRIYDKTSLINYNNETLNSSFDHLFNHAVTGIWNLIVKDTDPSGSGTIDSWKLIITYNSDL